MNKESIIAIVRIVLPCIVSVLGVLGITTVCGVDIASISVEQVCSILAAIIGAVASIYTGWKNNNVTKEAQLAQTYLDEFKSKDE